MKQSSIMKESTIKLVKSSSCPGAAAFATFLAERHLSYGIDAIDLPGDDTLGQSFVNSATNLVLCIEFQARYPHEAMQQVLELAVWAVTMRAVVFDYHWIDGGFSGDPERRDYLLRIAWAA